MKKAEIFARVIKVWPEGVEALDNLQTGEIISVIPRDLRKVHGYMQAVVHNDFGSIVTRAQWEAERERILLESQPERDTFIKELVDIACGKRSKEDQELWDKSYFRAWKIGLSDAVAGHMCLEAVESATTWAAHMADKFMAERAKRMKG